MKQRTHSRLRPLIRLRPRGSVGARSEEGQSLYELAWAMPLLAMLMIGIIFGGITFYDYIELAEGVAAGARTLATNRQALAGGTSGQTACVLEEAALKAAAANLTKPINITETFSAPKGSTTPTSTNLQQAGDTATVNATYPCNLPIPYTSINLCPVAKGTIYAADGKTPIGSCLYTYCISSTITVSIE